MKKCIIGLAVLLLMLFVFQTMACCERVYLISDSNTRYLTVEELWKWDYESLGYILNEIFARHGYVFESGGKYEYYFNNMPWYTPNRNPDNSKACYPQLNSIEWYNESLIKEVRADMRKTGNYNTNGKSVWEGFSGGFDILNGFVYENLRADQKLAVYSAPDYSSWRGANGKAKVSTNGRIYSAGWENGWLLVMYETNNGSVRVGYVNGNEIKGNTGNNNQLCFYYYPAVLAESASLTDDPAKYAERIANLPAGTQVTYLFTYYNNNAWDYIETRINGQLVRGFIRAGSLQYEETDDVGRGYGDDEGEG